MFSSEEEWQLVNGAVYAELALAHAAQEIECSASFLRRVAGKITTAIMLADHIIPIMDDIESVPGIEVTHITIERLDTAS
jgi:hypothetical protein